MYSYCNVYVYVYRYVVVVMIDVGRQWLLCLLACVLARFAFSHLPSPPNWVFGASWEKCDATHGPAASFRFLLHMCLHHIGRIDVGVIR